MKTIYITHASRPMNEHPYEIRIENAPIGKATRRRLRLMIVEAIPDNDPSRLSEEDTVSLQDRCLAHFRETLRGTDGCPSSITIRVSDKVVTVEWTTTKAVEDKREEMRAALRVRRKIMHMARSPTRPPEWERYLLLRKNWPSKADSVLPLPDPDKVRREKAFYSTWLEQMRRPAQQMSATSIIRVLIEYLDMCIGTAAES